MNWQLVQILGMGVAVLALVGGVALLQARRSGRKSDERAAMAARNGWSHAVDVDGQQWRIIGTFGDTPFVAEAQRPRHDSAAGEIRMNRTRVVAQVAGAADGPHVQAALARAAERWPGSPPVVTRGDGVLTIALGQDLDAADDVEAFLALARLVVTSG